jgi:hypothetical protein
MRLAAYCGAPGDTRRSKQLREPKSNGKIRLAKLRPDRGSSRPCAPANNGTSSETRSSRRAWWRRDPAALGDQGRDLGDLQPPQFGGGKTHALTLLYHLAEAGPAASNWKGVQSLLDQAGLKAVPISATAVFVAHLFGFSE